MRGFTLLELAVASLLVTILALATGAANRATTRATIALRDRARAVTELRMAVEWLRQDLGGARGAKAADASTLEIARADGAPLLYRRDGRRLLRDGTAVALELSGFEVSALPGGGARIVLATGTGDAACAMTLLWGCDAP